MKHLKRILAILLVIATFFGSLQGSWFLFRQGSYEFDMLDLAVYQDDPSCLYLRKAPKDIIFRVQCNEDTELLYYLTDENDSPMRSSFRKVSKGVYDILPPKEGYVPGGRYTLSLAAGISFVHEGLEKAKSVTFCIEREVVESYTLADEVVETEKAIQEINDSTIDITGQNVQSGDILFGLDQDDNYEAYKITAVNADGTATVEIPALDEIYSSLDVYNTYTWDVDDIIANPDLEIEIAENVRNSEFYNSLIVTAYAAEEEKKDGGVTVSVEKNDDNTLSIKIAIKLEPGKDGLFGIKQLKHQAVTLNLEIECLGLHQHANIVDLGNIDVSCTLGTEFKWNLEISPYSDDWLDKDSSLGDLLGKKKGNSKLFSNMANYQKNAKKIVEDLYKKAGDTISGELPLLVVPIPTAVPGLYFSADVKLFAAVEAAASINIGQTYDLSYTVGVHFVDGLFYRYNQPHLHLKDTTLSISGKVNAKAGVKVEIAVNFISAKVAQIAIVPEAGLYADLYVTFPIANRDEITDQKFLYSYFEPGAYFSASITAKINLVVKKYETSLQLVEKKFPIDALTFGNKKIALDLSAGTASVRAQDTTFAPPDILFRYMDVTTGMIETEALPLNKLEFVTDNNQKLKVTNGKLTIPDAASEIYVRANYTHTDEKTYSTTFRVVASGSILEGKVSAYDVAGNHTPLQNAKVTLYSGQSQTNPLTNRTTGSDGKFQFNVAAGEYTLVIAADGYKTLTSTQTVAEDEIKYTEHLMLIDESQSGLGSAGGHVENALDGRGISGATIRLRQDWNNTEGPYLDFTTTTGSDGKYTVSNVPVGYYTVEASLNGYVTGYTNIIVLAQDSRSDYDFTITPVLNGNEVRIVLTWGFSPSDLDSHLLGRKPDGGTFNVYYNNKQYSYNGTEMANLDVDDTSSYGPETITILKEINGNYVYAVHDYTNKSASSSKAMSNSDAVVRVFLGSRQVAQYHIPTDQVGTYWTVFEITPDYRIIPVNIISNTNPQVR